MKKRQKVNLQQPQRNRTETEHFVNLIMTSTVPYWIFNDQIKKFAQFRLHVIVSAYLQCCEIYLQIKKLKTSYTASKQHKVLTIFNVSKEP